MSSSSASLVAHRPNKELSDAERKAKKSLKKSLKAKKKKQRLQVKLQHAIRIQSQEREITAREELSAHNVHEEKESEEVQKARAFTLGIYTQLKNLFKSTSSRAKKQHQTAEAKILLQHMTKATQMSEMFDSTDALWGYARQKFQERALLVFRSLSNLKDHEEEWTALTRLRSICSIACGPGGDFCGAAAFCQQFSSQKLQQVHLLDYVIEQWNTILTPLKPILAAATYAKTITSNACDITKPLDDETNKAVPPGEVDLYLFSYILTECRDKWQPFVLSLIEASPAGTLFYFAEPTPWQLHLLIAASSKDMKFTWIDSSFEMPHEMQALDGRLGPAVLMGRIL